MRKYYPILFFALVALLVFWKVLFHREFSLLAGADISFAYFPWFDVAAYWLKRGVFLLWDPYVSAGRFNMGEPQAGLFYPLNWLLILMPARSGGVNLSALQALLIFDYFLAGLFFYFLARSLQLTSRGAAVAGIAWAYGGFMTQLYGYINVLSGFVWLPLGLLFFRRALLNQAWRRRVACFLASGCFVALSFLPGHHVPPVHLGLLLFFYAAFILARDWKENRWSDRAGVAAGLGIAALTGMALTTVQWLPSLGWARQVYRWIGSGPPLKWGEPVPYSALQRVAHLSPQDVVSLLIPYVTTNLNLYVGFTLLFLALIGALFVGERDTRFCVFAAFLYFFLSLGQLSALHGWVNTFVPGIWFAREVFCYLIPFQACLALLAGWGLDYLVLSYSGVPSGSLHGFVRRCGWVIAILVVSSGALLAALILRQRLPLDHPHVRGVAALAVYMAAFGFLLFFLHSRRISPHWFGMLATALIVVDLSSHFSDDIRAKADTGDAETTYVGEMWKRPPAAEFLIARHTHEHFRVDDPERVFPNNFGDAWRLDAALGYSATALVDFFSLRGTGWQPCSNASSLLNIRYFLSRFPVPELEKVFDGGAFVYRNPRAVARAFVARRYRTFADDRAMLDWVAGPLMVPGETVLLRAGDRDRLPRSFWDETANDDEGIEVQLLAATKAAQKNAAGPSDEEAKRSLFLYQLPWGWSAGDEATVLVRPSGHDGAILLVLNYYPVSQELSHLKVQLHWPEESRELAVELGGLGPGEPTPEQPKKYYVRLDDPGNQPFRLSLRKGETCSARIDSFRFARLPQRSGEEEAGTVTIISREPNRLLMSAKIERPSFVVLSEVFYPGWEALVDGKPAPVIAGDFVLRAVPVISGRHSIELRFRPRILLWGLIVSLASACMVVLLIVSRRGP